MYINILINWHYQWFSGKKTLCSNHPISSELESLGHTSGAWGGKPGKRRAETASPLLVSRNLNKVWAKQTIIVIMPQKREHIRIYENFRTWNYDPTVMHSAFKLLMSTCGVSKFIARERKFEKDLPAQSISYATNQTAWYKIAETV